MCDVDGHLIRGNHAPTDHIPSDEMREEKYRHKEKTSSKKLPAKSALRHGQACKRKYCAEPADNRSNDPSSHETGAAAG